MSTPVTGLVPDATAQSSSLMSLRIITSVKSAPSIKALSNFVELTMAPDSWAPENGVANSATDIEIQFVFPDESRKLPRIQLRGNIFLRWLSVASFAIDHPSWGQTFQHTQAPPQQILSPEQAVPINPDIPPQATNAHPPDTGHRPDRAHFQQSLTPGWVVYGKRRHAEPPEEDVPPQLYPW